MIYTKNVEIICPYCNKINKLSLILDDGERKGIYTCYNRWCKKNFVLVYNTRIEYKTYRLAGAEIVKVAKENG